MREAKGHQFSKKKNTGGEGIRKKNTVLPLWGMPEPNNEKKTPPRAVYQGKKGKERGQKQNVVCLRFSTEKKKISFFGGKAPKEKGSRAPL